jgi:Na+-transporting NADH:ubiquinone oxidoreductase subunit A
MSKSIQIKKGLDIKLKGIAEKSISSVNIEQYALKPTDFIGIEPKMSVNVGDKVKAGTIVFFDKKRDYLNFASPVSGTITEVLRGEKRKIMEIRIESDGSNGFEDFGKANPSSINRDSIIEKLLKSGVWSYIKQRPYSVIANPTDVPKAIFISAFDSSPLAPDSDLVVEGKAADFQTGIDALVKLTSGKVHLNIKDGVTKSDVFLNAKNVTINRFRGPHPAGNVGVQIHHLDPINKGEMVWVVDPQAVIIIGRLFSEGKYNAEKIISVVGSEVTKPSHYKVINGANILPIINKNVSNGENRYISGNVLTGTKIEKSGYLSFYHNMLTVIPEGNQYQFFGWLIPSPAKHSFYRTAFSWLTPNKEFSLNTNLNGGERAFVVTGELEKVLPMNIYPIQLMKAILVDDIEKCENLGIYELDEEDIALCEYINTSKIEMQEILRRGLDLVRKEMS